MNKETKERQQRARRMVAQVQLAKQEQKIGATSVRNNSAVACGVLPKDRPMNKYQRDGSIKERYVWDEQLNKPVLVGRE